MNAEDLAEIHAAAMVVPGPWSAATFEVFLGARGCVLATEGRGFALGRVVADEAEVLTLAVHPDARRKGLGRRCLAELECKAARLGAVRAFLEVAVTNEPARALYRVGGYGEDGVRRGYYAAADGQRIDAVLMSKALDPA